MTKIWTVPADRAEEASGLEEAARLLREGRLVAFPTETVYGLGADARNEEAVEGIFRAKGRPSDNPLIVHIADRAQLDRLAERVDDVSAALAERFWPGPLTLVVPARPGAVSERVTAGLPTVAVRMPDHPVARALIRASGCPVAAPSANRSGRPSPTRAEHVREDLAGRIDGIVDGGPTGVGVESTVVEVQGGTVHVLRPGGVTPEALRAAGFTVAGDERSAPAAVAASEETARPKSPGMKYKHYAPMGVMTVVRGRDAEAVFRCMQAETDRAKAAGHTTGVLAFREHLGRLRADAVLDFGASDRPEENARLLYDALRRFDEAGVTHIMAEAGTSEGIGWAVLNRLLKAAGNRLVEL